MNPCSFSTSGLKTSCISETVLHGSNFLRSPNDVLIVTYKVDCLGHAKGNNSRLRMFRVNPITYF